MRLEFFISIHAAREGGDCLLFKLVAAKAISIHAAREGGDTRKTHTHRRKTISIHAAREGGDHNSRNLRPCDDNFNPRRP